jgi:hypothetical protein
MTENIERSLKPEPAGFVANVWHEPLPFELARERQPLVRLLDAVLTAANVSTCLRVRRSRRASCTRRAGRCSLS